MGDTCTAQYAPTEVRQALIRVIDQGSTRSSAAAPGGASGGVSVHTSSQFPHLCLSKLYVLCSRGQDSEPKEQSVRCGEKPGCEGRAGRGRGVMGGESPRTSQSFLCLTVALLLALTSQPALSSLIQGPLVSPHHSHLPFHMHAPDIPYPPQVSAGGGTAGPSGIHPASRDDSPAVRSGRHR